MTAPQHIGASVGEVMGRLAEGRGEASVSRWKLSDCEAIALDRRLLAECVKGLSAAKRRAIFEPYQKAREFFAHTSAPGHAFWYPIKVQEEARAAEVLGFPVPPYAAALAAQEQAPGA